ncbi:MAG TPA: 4Fe-4S dicluster domain-containing protein [Spirochaetes bacterium]|nr:4Fe-4S dicluster domain-containing protein [Spirochaetota bacterium]
MSDKAFLVDTTKCSGCRACQVACKQWNNLPGEKTEFFGGPELTNPKELSAITYNHVKFFEIDRSNPERPVWTIMHKKCYHCEEANCLRVCPQKAISKVDGWTVIDQSLCIGCGACVNECVYKVPHVNEESLEQYGLQKPIARYKSFKCHACTVNKRDVPACANACPTGALTVDYRLNVLKTAKARLKEVKKDYPNASIYGENEFGGLHVITILKDRPEKYGLPVNVKPIEITKAEAIKDTYRLLSMFTFGLPSLKRVAYRISRSLTDGDRTVG